MIINSIDLNKMSVFCSVMKAGGFRLAEEELGLTRSAISQSISSLEGQMGVELFLRKGRRVFPTPVAEELYREVLIYQNGLKSALGKALSKKGRVSGEVRVGCYFEFAKYHLSQAIGEFASLYPEAQIKLTLESPSKLKSMLEQGKVDLNFSVFPVKDSKQIASTAILRQTFDLVLPTSFQSSLDHSLREGQELEKLLCGLPWVDYHRNYRLSEKWMDFHFGRKTRNLPIRVFASSAEMVFEFIAQGVGAGVLASHFFESELHGDKRALCRKWPVSSAQMEDSIWMNYYVDQFSNSAHERFFEFVADRFAAC